MPETQRSSHLSTVTTGSTVSNNLEDEVSAKDAYIRLLFGVPGCGKTKSMFDILSSNWGLYVLPGGRSESVAGQILQKDSVLLWSTISKIIDSLGNVCGEEEIRSSIDRFIEAFIACRLREFKRIYQAEYSSCTNPALCTHWLQYQLTASCVNDNHFQRYFAIARHLPQSRVDLHPGSDENSESDIFPNWLPRGNFYFCLDEFQSDFDRHSEVYSVPAGYKYSPASHGLMHNVFDTVLEFKLKHTIQKGLQWRILLAGTSTYLTRRPIRAQSDVYYEIHSKFEPVKNFQDEFPEFLLAHTDQVFSEAWSVIRTTYESDMAISGHRTILSERIMDADRNMRSSAWDCLQSSALLVTSGRHVPLRLRRALLDLFNKTQGPEAVAVEIILQSLRAKIRAGQEFITKLGVPLRGRHLWSSRYAQLILAIAIEDYLQTSNEDFRTNLQGLVAEIERKVITELILSLKKLRKTSRLTYSHICRLAIRADALNKPTLFPDDYTGGMVTRGFAFAYSDPKNSNWKEGYVKIGEPLAIKAVLEYLQSDDKGKMEFERQSKEIVYMNQDSASGLGFSAEHYLATVSRNSLALIYDI